MKRTLWPLLAALLALAALTGCGGGGTKTVTVTTTNTTAPSITANHPATTSCPKAANGGGHPGVCGPAQPAPPGRRSTRAAPGISSAQYPDLSNNDPCVCGPKLKAEGYRGLIVKANQGTGFIDSTAVPMVQSARGAGLAIGAYDFDQDYSVAEAATFVARLHAAGIFPKTPNTFPAYLDVEYGNFNYWGLLEQIAYLRAHGYRVGIYTGEWYWGPHAGCRWPAGITAWISGYPVAQPVCGLPGSLFNSHQYTSTPFDKSVFLGPGTFAQFVNAAPVPPPLPDLRILDKTVRNLPGGLHASEYATAKNWVQWGCKVPPLRAKCRADYHEMWLLAHRIWVVGHPLGGKSTMNLFNRDKRFGLLHRLLYPKH